MPILSLSRSFPFNLTSSFRPALIVAAAMTACSATSAMAADISWVGYQAGPPYIFRNSASWFHGDQWLNYVVPGASDTAIFDTSFDPQGNGMPRNVYFGDFLVSAQPPTIPFAFTVPGGNATVDRIDVRQGAFNFRFTNSSGNPQGNLSATNYIEIGSEAPNGTPDRSASLTITSGHLSQTSLGNWAGITVGQGFRSTGTLIVDGVDAQVSTPRDIWVGNGGGTGRLEVRNGALVNARGVFGGFYGGPGGELRSTHIVVDGQGSRIIANTGVDNGTLSISNGGEIDNRRDGAATFVFFGTGDGSNSVCTVDGGGSRLHGIDRLTVGGVYHTDTTGRGEMTVSNGGAVSASLLSLGNRSRSQGTLNVRGIGSTLIVNDAYFGDDGRGTTLVENGGTITVNSFSAIGLTSNGSGTFTARGIGSRFHTGSLAVGREGSLGFLTVRDQALSDIDTRVELGQRGTLDVGTSGRVEIGTVTSPALAGQIRIGSGGTLAGNGSVIGDVLLESGGTISPGFSPGLLNITGSLALLPASTLFMEIAGSTPGLFDRLILTGDATLGGTLALDFINGFVPSPGSRFDIISAGGTFSGNFNAFDIRGIDPSLVSFSSAGGSFGVNIVPTPSAMALLGLGGLMVARRRR